MYGGIYICFIAAGQWARNNSAAVWIALVSSTAIAIINISSNLSVYIKLSLAFVPILFLIGLVLKQEKIMKWLMMAYVKYRFDQSKVAVLNGQIYENDRNCTPPDVRYPPQSWKDQLEKEGLKVDLIPASIISSKKSKKYSIIINPFGSHYIEEDFTNLKTLNDIKKFIHDGGIFVNTWNIAFWESWNPRKKLGGATSPSVVTYSLDASPWPIEEYNHRFTKILLQPRIIGPSLIDTWLFRKFGVRTTFFEHPLKLKVSPAIEFLLDIGENNITEFRAALNSEKEDLKFYRFMSAPLDETHECYPVAAVNYYIGFLILFGTDITSDFELNFECRIIKKLFDKLSIDGKLS
jgi:hypothetical protein